MIFRKKTTMDQLADQPLFEFAQQPPAHVHSYPLPFNVAHEGQAWNLLVKFACKEACFWITD